MAEELKPCPFCGGEAEAYYVIDGSFACSCTSCSYASCAGFNTEQEAIAAWNTRAERTHKAMKCPIMSNRYSHGSADCIEEACAWWCAKSCAAAYIGAAFALDIVGMKREQQEGGDNGNAHD